MELNRYLMKELIEYMVKTDENVDWETADFSFGTRDTGKEKRAARSASGETENYYMTKSDTSDGGRTCSA